MSYPGKFIVVEGLEGAGKSSAIHQIVQQIKSRQRDVKTVREPGGTALGEALRELIKNTEYKSTMSPKTELLMLYAARIQLLEEEIIPALKQGTWVVSDRFELSSFAYQGGGRQLSLEFIEQLSAFCLNDFKPDLTLLLAIDPALGLERAKGRGALDRIEMEAMDFFNRTEAVYLQKAKKDQRIKVIDAAKSFKEVQSQIQRIITRFLNDSVETKHV